MIVCGTFTGFLWAAAIGFMSGVGLSGFIVYHRGKRKEEKALIKVAKAAQKASRA